jgi:hypothetical protein
MQAANVRYVVLTLVLLVGAAGYAALGAPRGMGEPRWPELGAVYDVGAWTVRAPRVEVVNRSVFVTRAFERSGGGTATLTIVTSQEPKVYGAGAEVPFLGNGYSVEPAPPDMVSTARGVSSLVATGSVDRWLVMYAFGERRGLTGNGSLGWTLAVIDGLLGRPNDYYKLYLMARVDGLDPGAGRDVAELAGTVFPRVAAWYTAEAS